MNYAGVSIFHNGYFVWIFCFILLKWNRLICVNSFIKVYCTLFINRLKVWKLRFLTYNNWPPFFENLFVTFIWLKSWCSLWSLVNTQNMLFTNQTCGRCNICCPHTLNIFKNKVSCRICIPLVHCLSLQQFLLKHWLFLEHLWRQ